MTVVALTSRVGARRIPADHNNPATWLRRGEVARLLGVTSVAVLRAEKAGALHPIVDVRGDKLFDPDEVNAYAVCHPRHGRRIFDDGELAAEAAKLFAAGAGRREVVMTLRVTFARADELYAEWARGDKFDDALAARAQEQARGERSRAQARSEAERARRRAERYRLLRDALRGGEPRGRAR